MENLPHSEQERGSHTVSLATSRGKRPVPCLDCLGVDRRQFFGSIVSALMTHLELWTGRGLCGYHASEGGRKAALSTPHRNTEAQTDWRGGGGGCHGSRQEEAGGNADQDTAGEEGAGPESNQPCPQK